AGLSKLLELAIHCGWIRSDSSLRRNNELLEEAWKGYFQDKIKKARVNSTNIHSIDEIANQTDFTNQLSEKGSDYLRQRIVDTRNELAHGSRMLHPWSIRTLKLCAHLINQLFILP
ncbi:MAG TPA: hypothetical protein VFK21_03755, partial [Gammaproteobacteria bacterium]|nr:hypothetical protein [Gammaproteobacteria bacterium]